MANDGTEAMIANLATKTGRTLPQWLTLLSRTDLAKHGEIMRLLKTEHGVSHGYANFIALRFLAGDRPPNDDALIAAQYAGAKESLRPLYEAVVREALLLGDDVEVAPKKTYVALRRTKQFAQVEPATRT